MLHRPMQFANKRIVSREGYLAWTPDLGMVSHELCSMRSDCPSAEELQRTRQSSNVVAHAHVDVRIRRMLLIGSMSKGSK